MSTNITKKIYSGKIKNIDKNSEEIVEAVAKINIKKEELTQRKAGEPQSYAFSTNILD